MKIKIALNTKGEHIYTAHDGTVFKNSQECLDYENKLAIKESKTYLKKQNKK